MAVAFPGALILQLPFESVDALVVYVADVLLQLLAGNRIRSNTLWTHLVPNTNTQFTAATRTVVYCSALRLIIPLVHMQLWTLRIQERSIMGFVKTTLQFD